MSDGEFKISLPMEAGPDGGFIQRIQDRIKNMRTSAAIKYIGSEALQLAEDALDAFKTKGLTLPSRDVFLKQAEAMYDQLCKLVDIPGIPEAIEQVIEKAGKPSFLTLAGMAYDLFVRS